MPPSPDDRAPQHPNIVLIIDDQHNPRVLGHTGECEVQTPHLDQLAAQSVVFSNAYCNNPVCAPTRHTLYTGLYASDHGVYVNDLPMREDVTTLMAALNEAGYTTANVGKMHNCPYHHRRDFQYVLHHEFYVDAAGISHYPSFLTYELERRGIERPSRRWSQPRKGYASWLRDPEGIAGANWMPEDLTPEHWITDQSLAFVSDQLAQRPDQPFFLHASYFPPHHPYRPIRKYAELYDPELLTMPRNWDPGQALLGSPGNLSEADVRRFRALYFGFVTQLDAEIGRLLDGLDALGVADDTIVIFLSDHGDMLGEHGRMYKGVMYEGSARVPFMVRWPGVTQPRSDDTLISHADVVPTLLRAAGLEDDALGRELPGRDLTPLLAQGPVDASWDNRSVYAEYFSRWPYTHLMLRRGPFKLIRSREGDQVVQRLFHLEEDPWELRDLAGDPAHADVLRTMAAEMDELWERQRSAMPAEPPAMPWRRTYDIPWPADPWEPVRPVGWSRPDVHGEWRPAPKGYEPPDGLAER